MNKKLFMWLAIFVFTAIFISLVSGILFPFIFGIFLAYFFDPFANYLCKKNFSRSTAAAIVVCLCMLVILSTILLLIPVVIQQGQHFLLAVPDIIHSIRDEILPRFRDVFPVIASEIAEHATVQVENKASALDLEQIITVTGKNFIDSGTLLFNVLSMVFITPIVSFYILRDWAPFKAYVDTMLPRQHAADIRKILKNIDIKISAFLRGQINVCLILSIYYALFLSFTGLHFGLLIGFLAGFLCFIPYLGTISGIFLGLIYGYFQFGADPIHLGTIFVIFGIGQLVEGNYLTPKIIGDRLGLHPAILIFGMLAGGALLGITGVILAVPITAVISVLVQYAIEKYFSSELYKGA